MRAITQNGYGGPELLKSKQIDRPTLGDSDVLVRVRAASVHAGDYFIALGVPYVARFSAGWPKPKDYVPGYDVAGVVETAGGRVTGLKPGDEVFGECGGGGCAEFVSAAAERFVLKPRALSFEQAAVVPISGLAALQGLRDAAKVRPGQRVLINGASGGVGTFAVQIAKWLGAEVTGVCSTRNVELVGALGADYVVDYTREDFTQGSARYDVIFDNVANRTFAECRRSLAPGGIHVPNSGHAGIGYLLAAFMRSLFVKQQAPPFLSQPTQADLLVLKQLLEAGTLRPVIDREYPLERTAEALAYVGAGHARGKVVITL